jgi:thioredoxin-like negative regulator of GroEL
MRKVSTNQEVEEVLRLHDVVLMYFSSPDCQVCHVLKPKIEAVVNEYFPQVEILDVNIALAPELAAIYSVFAAPTIVICVEGKESVRWSRSISVDSVVVALKRYVELLDL